MNNTPFHFLLADDDPDDHELFISALERLPVNLTVTENGQQLMQWLNENRNSLPRILFLDLNMPIKNGYECLREIKQSPLLKDLPVIILSTSSFQNEVKRRLYENGALFYMRNHTA